jgi:hypothetical protein
MNEHSSRSHAIATLHVDSWAQHGSTEDQDAEQGEQLLKLLQQARTLLGHPAGAAQGCRLDGEDVSTGEKDPDNAGASGTAAGGGGLAGGCDSAILGEWGGGDAVDAGHTCRPPQATPAHVGAAAPAAVPAPTVPPSSAPEPAATTPKPTHAGSARRMKRYGKLVIVDLAGSERLKSTGSSGITALKEAGSINKSLFTLGQVLHALSAQGPGRHAQPVRTLCSTFFQVILTITGLPGLFVGDENQQILDLRTKMLSRARAPVAACVDLNSVTPDDTRLQCFRKLYELPATRSPHAHTEWQEPS